MFYAQLQKCIHKCIFELTTQQKERGALCGVKKLKKGPVQGKFKHLKRNLS